MGEISQSRGQHQRVQKENDMRMYKERCKMQRRGFCDTEYITKDGQERGACYGYRDRANDEILDQCKNCLDFVWNVGEEERL